MSTTIGLNLTKGVGETIAGYLIQRITDGGADIDMEDYDDGNDGSRAARIVFKVDDKLSVETLTTKDLSAVKSDFPEGGISTIFGTHFVDSCQVDKSREAWRVNVELTDIGIA
jgi:hypothetical protein